MKILRKWLLNWVQKAKDERDRDQKSEDTSLPSGYRTGNSIGNSSSMNYAVAKDDGQNRLNFNVMPAAGGVVISINKYDAKAGRHTEILHVIHDDEDVATNIGHIVSMELLRS